MTHFIVDETFMTKTRIKQLKDAIATGRVTDEIEKVGFYSDFILILDLAESAITRRENDNERLRKHRQERVKSVTLRDAKPPTKRPVEPQPSMGPHSLRVAGKPTTPATSIAAVLSKVGGAKPTTGTQLRKGGQI